MGTYLDALPVDPYSGKDYLFFPQGTPNSFAVRHPKGMLIPAGTPFLWGRGPELLRNETISTRIRRSTGQWERCSGHRSRRQPALEYGWAIVIGTVHAARPDER